MPPTAPQLGLSRRGAILALTAAWCLFFGRVAASSALLMSRDLRLTHLPLFSYMRERLARGEIPQWFPYEMLGAPYAGSIIATPYHPRTLLLAFGAPLAIKWAVLLAYAVGLSGAYRLVRTIGFTRPAAVAGAIACLCSGYGISVANKLNMLHGFVAAPWMLAAVVRLTRRERARDVASLGIWWALIFLGGDPQLGLACGFVAVGLLIAAGAGLRTFARFGLSAVLAASLAAAELLPAAYLMGESTRGSYGATTALADTWALHPLRIAELVIPGFLPDAIRGPAGGALEGYGEPFIECVFIGGLTAFLAVLGATRAFPGRRVWLIALALAFLLALGGHAGLLPIWWKVAPIFVRFRYPEKYLSLVALALTPLAAAGVEGVLAAGPRLRAWLLRVGLLALAVGVIVPAPLFARALLATSGTTLVLRPYMETLAASWSRGLVETGVFLVGTALLLRLFQERPALVWILPTSIALELWASHAGFIQTTPPETIGRIGALSEALAAQRVLNEPPPRALRGELSPPEPGATGPLIGVDTRADVGSFERILPTEPERVEQAFFAGTSLVLRDQMAPLLDIDEWSARFHICYRIATPFQPALPSEQAVSPPSAQGVRLVRRPSCQAAAWLSRAEPVANASEAIERMRGGLPPDFAVWEGGPRIPGGGGSVQWLRADPEHLRLRANASAPSGLAWSMAFASGWSAAVDGVATPIYPTDEMIQGIQIPQGTHTVEVTYRAPGLWVGQVLSVAALIVCGALFWGGRSRRRRPG